MRTDYFVAVLAIAGIAVLWRNLIFTSQAVNGWLARWVDALPMRLSKSLTCGSCITYWLALAYSIWLDPFNGQYGFIISWMALAMGAVFIRFAYVALQELVTYQTHVLGGKGHKH